MIGDTGLGTVDEQFAALGVMGYLQDLFTATEKSTFSRADILVLLNTVAHDPNLFSAEAQDHYATVDALVQWMQIEGRNE